MFNQCKWYGGRLVTVNYSWGDLGAVINALLAKMVEGMDTVACAKMVEDLIDRIAVKKGFAHREWKNKMTPKSIDIRPSINQLMHPDGLLWCHISGCPLNAHLIVHRIPQASCDAPVHNQQLRQIPPP